MSIYLASTQAFINLYKRGIISQESFNQIYQQTKDLEDDENIAEAIEDWLDSQNDSQLLEAYDNQHRKLTNSTSLESGEPLGPGNTKSPTPVGEPNPTSRELLDNIMIKNKPSADDNSQSSSSST